jgi:hypothetical protein
VSEGIYLPELFDRFCDYFDGKLDYGAPSTEWTDLVLGFFDQQAARWNLHVLRNYMLVDQIWRGPHEEILLAMDHENVGTDVNELLTKEVDHLVSLRARSKVGIFYPNLGDEKTLLNGIGRRISDESDFGIRIPNEEYMFILGFSTRKGGKRAISFKAYFYDAYGKETRQGKDPLEHVILQAEG